MKEINLSLAHCILEIIPNGAYIFQDGSFVFVNAEACRVSGYSADELLGIG